MYLGSLMSQIKVLTAKRLVPDPCSFEIESAVAKLKKYKSQVDDRILTALISAGGETVFAKNGVTAQKTPFFIFTAVRTSNLALVFAFHIFISFIWSKE
jgi:hypothetical protein